MMGITVKQLGAHIGGEITGFDVPSRSTTRPRQNCAQR
jgi:hypothetical protein